MKRTYIVLLPIALLTGVLLAACGQGGTPTPAGPQDVPVSEITNITWQWVELIENNPAGQSVVADPENYTLTFLDDGSVSIKADCNTGNGRYTVDGNKLEFNPIMALTMALCPPGSLHDQFLRLLGQVDTFGSLDGRLVLVLKDGAGEMRFQNGGTAEQSGAASEEITLYIGPELVPCEGEGPMECYQVKESPDAEWGLFYDQIEGFNWEPGFVYELRVRVSPVDNPPAGGSSLQYELIEEVSKEPVNQ